MHGSSFSMLSAISHTADSQNWWVGVTVVFGSYFSVYCLNSTGVYEGLVGEVLNITFIPVI
jgi:hypothetical protein